MSGGTYGGFAPQPERYGGGKRRIEYILDALLQSDQTEIGLDTTPAEFSPTQNPVWIEELATARAISAAWGTNTRGSNEFYPLKTMSMLPRWQVLFGIVPPSFETAPQQRAYLTFKWQALYKNPTPGQIADDLAYLGTTPDGTQTVFTGITYTNSTTGPQYYPGGGASNPYAEDGVTVAGLSLVDWWSATLNVLVNVVQPVGMNYTVYQYLTGNIAQYLDGALPAWMTYSLATSVGFFLDTQNLNFEAFAT